MHDEVVRIWTEGPVGIMELNRPQVFNCLALSVMEALNAGMRRFEDGEQVRAVLIRSTGKHFCTGADLDEVLEARASRASLESFLSAGHEALMALERSRLPVVAAVHGLCLAGGLELSMACDVVFAASSARFGDQHSRYGLIPGWGGTQRLPRLVGLRRALHLMYSAEWLDAAAAREWGLVNLVVDDAALADRAMAYAQALATRNPESVAAMKSLARSGLDEALSDGLAHEASCVVDVLRSENVSEGLTAFHARREPRFI